MTKAHAKAAVKRHASAIEAPFLHPLRAIRRQLLTRWLMPMVAKTLPTIGETERIALEAGDVWFEAELFSGKPDLHKLMDFPIQPLSAREKAFLEGPVNKLCAMLDDWDIHQRRDLPPAVWAFLKKERFFGMIIPQKHGGLEFSAAAHAAVVTRIATRSVPAAVTVMVPNSLGPAELLLNYGTPAQQKQYLKRLATGQDLPCFALTEPTAGSDAASGISRGVVTHGTWKGKRTLGINLTFNKRYITLAPVATVVGLAFNLEDPEGLLGNPNAAGITCALLPRSTPGLKIGKRHDPMGVPFQNGPVSGENVFIPLDYIIGGRAGAGQGWRMLMECLAAGRGISLPSLSVGAAQLATRTTAAYATVREQFGLPIGRFEGVRAPLARTAGLTYAMNAMRRLTTGALDAGHHPSVLAAIAKAYLTEGMRTTLNDGMDILAGAAIIRGPGNILARPYSSIPIGITVEGANILTRTLIVFGQGAMRCHPWLQKEVDALQSRNLKAFDEAFFGHITHALMAGVRAFVHGLTGGRFIRVPKSPLKKQARQLAALSKAFALLSEVALATLGGNLKRAEHLSGRFADALAWLTIGSAVLKHAHDTGHPEASAPVAKLAMAHALYTTEQALLGILANLPNRLVAGIAGVLAFPLGPRHAPPTDKMLERVATALLNEANGLRQSLGADVFLPAAGTPGLAVLEEALAATVAVQPLRAKIQAAQKLGKLPKGAGDKVVAAALAAGVITKPEAESLKAAAKKRDAAIQVSSFTPDEYRRAR